MKKVFHFTALPFFCLSFFDHQKRTKKGGRRFSSYGNEMIHQWEALNSNFFINLESQKKRKIVRQQSFIIPLLSSIIRMSFESREKRNRLESRIRNKALRNLVIFFVIPALLATLPRFKIPDSRFERFSALALPISYISDEIFRSVSC